MSHVGFYQQCESCKLCCFGEAAQGATGWWCLIRTLALLWGLFCWGELFAVVIAGSSSRPDQGLHLSH